MLVLLNFIVLGNEDKSKNCSFTEIRTKVAGSKIFNVVWKRQKKEIKNIILCRSSRKI